MAVRYTGKVFDILMNIKNIVEDCDIDDKKKKEIIALLNMAESLTQAGHLVACGRTLNAFAVTTGLTVDQMRETETFKALACIMPGDAAIVKCPRDWFNYCRAILKHDYRSLRMRCRDMKNGDLLVTRLK